MSQERTQNFQMANCVIVSNCEIEYVLTKLKPKIYKSQLELNTYYSRLKLLNVLPHITHFTPHSKLMCCDLTLIAFTQPKIIGFTIHPYFVHATSHVTQAASNIIRKKERYFKAI